VLVMRPLLIDPNKTIESINARQTSVGQSEHHRERVILSWLPTEDLTPSGPQPCPTRAGADMRDFQELADEASSICYASTAGRSASKRRSGRA
jgi:hypothetical protein